MAARPYLPPFPVVTNGDMSANINSLITNIQQIPYVSYSVSWTGAPVGSFSVQVSNDYELNSAGQVLNAGTWDTLPLTNPVTASGSAGNGFIDIRGTSAAWIQLVYTATSGSGTLNATIAGKVV